MSRGREWQRGDRGRGDARLDARRIPSCAPRCAPFRRALPVLSPGLPYVAPQFQLFGISKHHVSASRFAI